MEEKIVIIEHDLEETFNHPLVFTGLRKIKKSALLDDNESNFENEVIYEYNYEQVKLFYYRYT